ncbi:15958_t:CDS:2 [Gigaspora margarita]|uniref:15958_t:CDS:1 n=1 Tax=Gigaspora margarita TaxID=4874 RepID=A0ABN7VB47_GIGMA|nr:15958_t:CDS:2 [Gigaspora margarita]
MDLNQIFNITSDPQDKKCSCYKKTKLLKKKKSSISEDNNSETSEISGQFDNQDKNSNLENEEDCVLYELAELEELVAMYFINKEKDPEIKFSKMFEFEDELIDNFQVLNSDAEFKIRKLCPFFLMPIESRYHYYWEIRKIYVHKNNLEKASIYLGCAQREDRKHKCLPNQLVKRISKIRPPINQYSCKENIVIHIDLNMHQAKIEIQHLISHEHPTYQKADINEIIVDSTYKTNQQKFELFVVLVNYGGHGVPFAYLYIDTFPAPKDLLQNPKNIIHLRLKVLREFFSTLKSEGVLPVFVLIDKDADQIAVAQEAWSGKIKIYLCLWHVKHAITLKAKDANQQFNFIDISWIPKENKNILYLENNIKEVLAIVYRHSILHPLIPINKVFFISEEIYYESVKKVYIYCKDRNLVHLWGYLWSNWYNKADWNLFARASFSNAIPLAWTMIIWDIFKSEWKKALDKEIDSENKYLTNIDNWTCSCPAFINNAYLNTYNRDKLIIFREVELEEDKKMFKFLINTVADNIQNDNFYNTYKRLRQTIITEAKACQEALAAKTQQKT